MHNTVAVVNETDSQQWVGGLTLSQWISIARAVDNSDRWGFYKWKENTSQNLSELPLTFWETVANLLDWSNNWAYRQYKEYNP